MTYNFNRRGRARMPLEIVAGGAAATVALTLLAGALAFPYLTRDTATVTIARDGERVCDRNGDCRYLEFAEGEVFQNVDSLAFLKFDSSDIHAKMSAGKTCELDVSGWRIPFFSAYRNIIGAECR